MDGVHPANYQSIHNRKETLDRNEKERPLSVTEDFDTNLVHFLWPYVIISNVHVYSFTGAIFHMHRRVPKLFCVHKISCPKNYNI